MFKYANGRQCPSLSLAVSCGGSCSLRVGGFPVHEVDCLTPAQQILVAFILLQRNAPS